LNEKFKDHKSNHDLQQKAESIVRIMDTKKLDIMCLAEVNKDLFEKINNYCSEKNNIKMVPSN